MLRLIRSTVLAKMSMLVVTARFVVVGVMGFLVNYAILKSFSSLFDLNKVAVEVIATAVALQVTFYFNDSWTYRVKNIHYTLDLKKRYLSYMISNAAGSFATIVAFAILHRYIANDLVALMVAATVGMAWNYFANLFLVWRQDTPESTSQD